MAVNRQESAVNFRFTISETKEVSLFDVKVKVYNPFVRIRYNEIAPFQSVGMGFVGLPDLTSRENVAIHQLDYYPIANRPGINIEEFYTSDSFFTEIGKFLITDIFIKRGTGLDIPLYLKHEITITTDLFIQSGSEIVVLDKNFDPVDANDYLVWEGPESWMVFHNFEHMYDAVTGEYEAYYVSYPLWDSVRFVQREHVELLKETTRFRGAEDDDFLPDFSLPPDETLYQVQEVVDRFLITVTYDIEGESPMRDLYYGGGAAPFLFAYRPQQLHEIGPLFPKSLSQDDPWFPVLTNGFFFAFSNKYVIAEYSQQPFIPFEPYKRVLFEAAILLARNLLKPQHKGIFVDVNNGFHLDVEIFDRNGQIKWAASTDTTKDFYIDAVGERTVVPYDHEGIVSLNGEGGLIQIDYTLVELDDDILVSYYRVEQDFEYVVANLNPLYDPDVAGKSIVLFLAPWPFDEAIPTQTVYDLLLDEEFNIEDSNAVPGVVSISITGNLSHGTILTNRGHTSPSDTSWTIEITQSNTVEGDITDAKYKYRQGSGLWSPEAFMTTSFVSIGLGVEIRFEAASSGPDFVAGDIWTIEAEGNTAGFTDDIFGMAYEDWLSTYALPDVTDPGWLVVAFYSVGSNRGLHDLDLVDTRVRGGGINPDNLEEARFVYPEIEWMFDIGQYDGKPFPGAAAIMVDLPANVLGVEDGIFTKQEVDSIVKHHLSLGVYPVIRYYCTNTGLVGHETVPSDTSPDHYWVVPGNAPAVCPDKDGRVICVDDFLPEFADCDVFYDSFIGDDGDPPNYWYDESNLSSYIEIRDNKFRMVLNAGLGNSAQGKLDRTFSGDFDIAVDYDLMDYPDVDGWSMQLSVIQNDWMVGATAMRGYYDVGGFYSAPEAGQQYLSFRVSTVTFHGHTITTDISGKMRIERIGTRWRTYYWDGLDWVVNDQFFQTTAVDDVYVNLGLKHINDYPGARGNWDNFCVSAADDVITTTTSTTSTTSSTTSSSTTSTTTTTSTTSSTASTSSTTSSTATASTSSSSTSTTTTEPFACTGSELADDMNFLNLAIWAGLFDSESISSFVGNMWRVDTINSNENASLQSWNASPFKIVGDFDLCVAHQIDTVEFNPGAWNSSPYIRFTIIDVSGNNNYIDIKVQGPGDPDPGKLFYYRWDNVSADTWYGPPAGDGDNSYHVFRLVRVGNVLTVYAWNPVLSRWEWDGDPAGINPGVTYPTDINRIRLNFRTAGNALNYLFSGFDYFYVNSGSVVFI